MINEGLDVNETGQSVRERWVDVDGTWVHTADWEPSGPAPGAAPVLLVHGLGGNTVNWELVGQPLADQIGTTVTAVDLPGFGRHPRRLPRPALPALPRAARQVPCRS